MGIYLLLSTAAAIFLAQNTLHPNRRQFLPADKNEMDRIALQSHADLQDVRISPPDHVSLRAWYIRQLPGNGDAVVLLHGVGDNRLGMMGYARILLQHGYSVLMPDARAHGMSGGDIATFGVMERNDIKEWFEWLQSAGQAHCIFGLGESMGAAELLQSLEVEPNFCAVIAESSFSSFREIAYDRMGQHFHAGPWVGRTILRPLVEIALAYARANYHLDLAAASPALAVAHTSVPVLLIHGEEDSNIPVYHSRAIKLENSNVELWAVPGADHCGAISVAPQELEHRITSWFEVHDGKSTKEESTIVGPASYRVSGEINHPVLVI